MRQNPLDLSFLPYRQDASFNEALAYESAGLPTEAGASHGRVLAREPRHGEAHFRLGAIALAAGNIALALPHLKAAVESNPAHGNYWRAYIGALRAAGHTAAADTMSAQLPPPPEIAGNGERELASLFGAGRHDALEDLARRLVLWQPGNAPAWKALGLALGARGAHAEALEPLRQAAFLSPDDPVALHALANTALALGRAREAESMCRLALELDPGFVEAGLVLAATLTRQGRGEEAEAVYRDAIAVRPDFVPAHSNLGTMLHGMRRYAQAETAFRGALALRPDEARGHNNLGLALQAQGRLDEAEQAFRSALRIDADYALAYSNLLLNLNSDGRHPIAQCVAEAHGFGRLAERLAGHRYRQWPVPASPTRLRVGLVSGDLGEHPVGYFLEHWIAHLAGAGIELHAFVTSGKHDALTERLRPAFASWNVLVDLADRDAAAMIHASAMHILIDLAGHTAGNRLPLFAWKPAPVQATWLGYFATTGVAAIDYLLADPVWAPAGSEAEFSEQVWRLATRLCFAPPRDAPPVSPLPAASRGYVTFGSFQNLAKLGEPVMRAWASILQQVPDARLRLQSPPLAETETRAALSARFRQHGIDGSRVDLLGPVGRDAYLAAHAYVDLILDTFPYPGGTTTCEALWMGVPTLTLAGDRMLARQGAGLLAAAGLPAWIASSPEEYVQRAVVLAGDLDGLAACRAELRGRVARSTLFDAPAFARDFAGALWNIWRRYESAAHA